MTTSLSERCSKCGEDGMNCKCEQFHPNIKLYEFTIDELRALYRVFEYEYINYEDIEAHEVVNKIAKIIREYE